MATRNYTRIGIQNPIDAVGMASWIASQTSLTITGVEIHPTDIDVTGTIVSGNDTVIQTAINSYVYSGSSPNQFVALSNVDNTFPMVDNTNKVATVHASVSGDAAVLAVANSKLSSPIAVSDTTGLQAFLDDKVSISSLATVATTGSYTDLINKPTYSQSSVTRTLNSIFQPSTTHDVLGQYSVRIGCTASLAGGQEGAVVLEISTSATFASGVVEIGRIENKNSVSLAIALTAIQEVTLPLVGTIPSGYYARLRTVSTTGSPTFTYKSGQESTTI